MSEATLTAYCQALAVRRANAANRAPPTGRVELISPYTDNQGNVIYTPQQLAMRRKIAILRYNTNAMTNTDNYVSAMTNSHSSTSYTATLASNNNCVANDFIPTSSTGMNVPGPEIIFTYDPTIPLYMYNETPR